MLMPFQTTVRGRTRPSEGKEQRAEQDSFTGDGSEVMDDELPEAVTVFVRSAESGERRRREGGAEIDSGFIGGVLEVVLVDLDGKEDQGQFQASHVEIVFR